MLACRKACGEGVRRLVALTAFARGHDTCVAAEETMRNAELEKIKNLDSKITGELKTLNERSATMKEELSKFGNIPQLREEAETNKRNMMARKQRLDGLRKSLKMQVQLLSSEYDKHKQALATNESAGTLEALETKLRHYEQNIYHLRDFIDSKEAETDYSGVYEVGLSAVCSLSGRVSVS